MTADPFAALPGGRDPDRIPLLLELLGREWARHPDERFFQQVSNLTFRLGLPRDSWNVEDDRLGRLLAARLGDAGEDWEAASRQGSGRDATGYLLSSPANAGRLKGGTRQVEDGYRLHEEDRRLADLVRKYVGSEGSRTLEELAADSGIDLNGLSDDR
ncbi:hypothetical protein ACFQ36_01675 [Arthrobacter sp. GCM10027362]|uniref:hypothetical protein n=1 Tax=Arthrobacter sp. GCM10027362 TaxID=3273379 RepID=UPI003633713E